MTYFDLKQNEIFLVSQKAIILNNKDEVLLLQNNRSDNPTWSEKWSLPGGLLEMSEDFENCLRREIKEETNLDITIKKILGMADFWHEKFTVQDGRILKARVVMTGYICSTEDKEITLDNENKNYKWFAKDELNNADLAPDAKQLVNLYLKY